LESCPGYHCASFSIWPRFGIGKIDQLILQVLGVKNDIAQPPLTPIGDFGDALDRHLRTTFKVNKE
jgi:hypothetical protein